MGTVKHTPGPWHRNIKPARRCPTVWAGRNTHVATVVPGAPWGSGNGADMSDEELEANIDLISAAPEMLEALKSARQQLVTLGGNVVEIDGKIVSDAIQAAALSVIEAAIARAEGRQDGGA